MNFNFYMPTRIHFGCGQLNKLGKITSKYGKKCFLVTTENTNPLDALYTRVKSILEDSGIEVCHFDQVIPNPTTEVVELGIKSINDFKGDFVLAVGGGSSIDTAKTIALLKDSEMDWETIFSTYNEPFGQYESISNMPLISVTTTAGTGSEVTQAAVITMGDDKNTIFHPDNYSTEAVLDPELLLTLPNRLTAATGFDAFTHAFESYINKNASPMSEMLSLEAMKIIIEALPKALEYPSDVSYRNQLMLAQMKAGAALANAGASAGHPISEIIGGIAHISHGEALALVFPEFIEVFESKNKEKFNIVSELFNKPLTSGVKEFLETINLYQSIHDYSLDQSTCDLIYNSPILAYLPFGSKEELQLIIEKSFNR